MGARRVSDWSLGSKLLALLLAAGTLPMLAAIAGELFAARALLDEQAEKLLQSRADGLADEVDRFLEAYLRAARRLASMPPIMRLCAAAAADRPAALPQASELLAAYATTDPGILVLAVLDPGATILASSDLTLVGRNYAFRPHLRRAAAGQEAVADLSIGGAELGHQPLVAVAVPVKDAGGAVAGVIAIGVHASALWEAFRAAHGNAGEGSSSVLLDGHGIRLAHSQRDDLVLRPAGALDAAERERFVAERRFADRTAELLEQVIPNRELFERARAGGPEGAFRCWSEAGRSVNIAWARKQRRAPWMLFYQVPEAVVAAPARWLVARSVLPSLILVALALAIGWLFGRRILRPVRVLSEAAERIGSGDLTARVTPSTRDELGALGRRFNDMATALAQARQRLEGEVQVRTRELTAANAELERTNRALAEQAARDERRRVIDHAFARILEALAGDGDAATVVGHALGELGAVCGATVLACYRLAGDRFEPVGTWALGAQARALPAPLDGLGKEAVRHRRPVAVDEVPAGVALRLDGVLVEAAIRSLLLVPLESGARPVGLLVAASPVPLPADARELIETVAAPFALTLSRHDLLAETLAASRALERSNTELRAQTAELGAQRAELEAQRRALEETNRQMERANRLKSEFLANMSHELRTPLNAVIGFSELLLDETRDALSPRKSRYLEDIRHSGRHLLVLINDILDLSKIEAGKLTLAFEAVEPAAAAGEALMMVDPEARRRRIAIRTPIGEVPPVRADRGRLVQVLVNLASNAVKFGPEGSTVEVGAEREGEAVRFWVRDEGPGIDPAIAPRLFEPFLQGESPLTKRHQGTGLGLAISKRLVAQHGGQLEYTADGAGTRFHFALPAWRGAKAETPAPARPGRRLALVGASSWIDRLRPDLAADGIEVRAFSGPPELIAAAATERFDAVLLAPGQPPGHREALAAAAVTRDLALIDLARAGTQVAPARAADLVAEIRRLLPAPPPSAPPPAVLVIDDDPSVASVLARELGPSGYEVVAAANGEEGLQRALLRPALVVVDLALPGLSGYDVIELLRAGAATQDLPILVLTAVDLADEDVRRLRPLVQAIARKGDFDRQALLATVERAIGRRSPAPARAATVLVVDDHDLNRELIRTLLEAAGHRVIEATNGVEAIEAVRSERPRLVLMDLAMPVMDGFAATRALKADAETRDIPVVALTALAMSGDERRASEAGCDGYLTKPVERVLLEQTVARFLSRTGPAGGGR